MELVPKITVRTLKSRIFKAIAVRADTRTGRVLATAVGAYLGRFGAAIVVLITLPLVRQALHAELFGVWMMLSALLGFMAFADLGVGNGVLNKITEAKAAGDSARLKCVLGSGYACTAGVGMFVMLAWLAWSCMSDDPTVVVGVISPENRSEAMMALTAFALVLGLHIPAGLIQRVQLGMQQGYWNGVAQFAGAGVTLVAVPLTLHSGGGLAGLVLATIGVQVAANIVNTVIWLHCNGLLRRGGWRGALDFGMIRALLRLGTMFFLLQLAASFAFQSDAIVITQTLGQAAYGDFAIVQRLFLFISILMSATMVGLWPAFGDALARGDLAWTRRMLIHSLVIASTVSAVAVVALSLSMEWLLTRWLQQPLTPPPALIIALATWTIIDTVALVASALMNGAGMLRAQLVIALTMAGLSFCGKWLATPLFGPAGAVFSTLLAYCIVSVPGQIYVLRKVFTTQSRS